MATLQGGMFDSQEGALTSLFDGFLGAENVDSFLNIARDVGETAFNGGIGVIVGDSAFDKFTLPAPVKGIFKATLTDGGDADATAALKDPYITVFTNSVSYKLGKTEDSAVLLDKDGITTKGTLTGNASDNYLIGNSSNNTILSDKGNDVVHGKGGADSILGNLGNDTLDGDDGNDTIKGEVGNDLLRGGAGKDSIDGGDGNDFIDGGSGKDKLIGGKGDDTIYGGSDTLGGNDTMSGGAGSDTFIIDQNSGNDMITDFSYTAARGKVAATEDKIEVSGHDSGGDLGLDATDFTVTEAYDGALISFKDGGSVLLKGIAPTSVYFNDDGDYFTLNKNGDGNVLVGTDD